MTSTRAVELEWAIRKSFVAYVEGLPDGGVEVEGGASRAASGAFVFPSVEGGALAFAGAVRFHGHGGVLDVTIADPRIEPQGDSAAVTVALGTGRIRFATVGELTRSDTDDLRSVDVAVTDDGAYVLGGVYEPGTALDPFTIHCDVRDIAAEA